jgi:hypothetical protein
MVLLDEFETTPLLEIGRQACAGASASAFLAPVLPPVNDDAPGWPHSPAPCASDAPHGPDFRLTAIRSHRTRFLANVKEAPETVV